MRCVSWIKFNTEFRYANAVGLWHVLDVKPLKALQLTEGCPKEIILNPPIEIASSLDDFSTDSLIEYLQKEYEIDIKVINI